MSLGSERKSKGETAWIQKGPWSSRMTRKPRDVLGMKFIIEHHHIFPVQSPFPSLSQAAFIWSPPLSVQQNISELVLFTSNLSAFKSLVYGRYFMLMK